MKRNDIVRNCLLEACHGQPQSLIGLLDYLIEEKGIDPERIIEIAERHFGINQEVSNNVLLELKPTTLH